MNLYFNSVYFKLVILCIQYTVICQSKSFDGGRIIGGEVANYGDRYKFGFMASINVIKSGSIKHKCGGSIISERIILTARHCFEYKEDETKLRKLHKPDELIIIVGSVYSNNTDDNGSEYEALKYYLYENKEVLDHLRSQKLETFERYNQDIAVIITKKEIIFNLKTYSINFPDDLEYDKEKLKYLDAAGWGRLAKKRKRLPQILHYVTDIPVINFHAGGVTYSETMLSLMAMPDSSHTAGEQEWDTRRLHRIKVESNDSSCKGSSNGDSGGPLFKWEGDEAYQFGIIASNCGCLDCEVLGSKNRGYHLLLKPLNPWLRVFLCKQLSTIF